MREPEYIGEKPEPLSFHFWRFLERHPFFFAYVTSNLLVIVTLSIIIWSK